MRIYTVAFLALTSLGALTPAVAQAQTNAQNIAAAQVLFEEAMSLMDEKKFVEACPKLEASKSLDPAAGTLFQLGVCYENIGRVASAYGALSEAADAAKAAGNDKQEAYARQRASQLVPRLPRLTIQVPPDIGKLPNVKITRNQIPIESKVWGLTTPVDPGEQSIEAEVDGEKRWTHKIQAREGETVIVIVNMPPLDEAKPKAKPKGGEPLPDLPPPPKDTASRGLSGQHVAGLVVGGVGVAGIVVGGVFGARTFSQWGEALSYCENGDKMRCSPTGVALSKDADTSATLANVGFGLGVAGLTGGLILWFTAKTTSAPSKDAAVIFVPTLSPEQTGGVLRARF